MGIIEVTNMKLHYYGTGDGYGIPEPLCSCRLCSFARAHRGKDIRTRSQAVLEDLMLDCSADMALHTLFYGLDMRCYRHILITHPHSDHYDLSQFRARYTDTEGWNLYIPESLYQSEQASLLLQQQNEKKNPPRRVPILHPVKPFEPFEIGKNRITPIPSNHMKDALLYLITRENKSVLWIHDSGLLLPETQQYLAAHAPHLDLVSMDCTLARSSNFTPSHMDILQCAETAAWLRSAGLADDLTVFVLSHIGHLIDRTHEELCAEAAALGFIVAYDNMEIDF